MGKEFEKEVTLGPVDKFTEGGFHGLLLEWGFGKLQSRKQSFKKETRTKKCSEEF